MKPSKLYLLALALNAAPLAHQFSPLAIAQPLPERRVLTGRITDDAGIPLPRINITLQRENDLGAHAFWGTVAVTDAQGRFRIDNAEEGAYLISAEGDGFSNLQNQQLRIVSSAPVWNVQLQRLTNVLLSLKDADGKILPKTRVAVRMSKSSSSEVENNRMAFARKMQRRADTSGKGELQLPNIEPGIYVLEIAVPGAGFAKIENFAVKYEAKPVAREVQLQRGGDVTLIARENGEDGRLLGGAVLTLGEDVQITAAQRAQGAIVRPGAMDLSNLYAWSSDGSRAVTSDGDGTLKMQDLAPGRYTARLVLPGYAPSQAQNFEVQSGQSQTLNFELKPRAKTTAVDFKLESAKGAELANREWTLQMRFLQALALGEAPATPLPDTLTIVPPEANLALPLEAAPLPPGALNMLIENEGLASFPGVVTRRVRSDENGKFSLYPLQSGRWMLTIFATPQNEGDARGPISQQTISISANNAAPIALKMQ